MKGKSYARNTHRERCIQDELRHGKPQQESLNAQKKGKLGKMESYKNNNNLFNGRHLSDHTPLTAFYSSKSNPPEEVPEKPNLPSGIFTNNLLNQFYDDNYYMAASTNPSSLVEVPRVNEKYEISSFANPQYQHNLKTMDILNNKDVILNMNPAFYGRTTQHQPPQPPSFANKENELRGFLANLTVKGELDHPRSFHNQTVGSKTEVRMEPLQRGEKPVLVQNGFYSRDPYALKGKFESKDNGYTYEFGDRITQN